MGGQYEGRVEIFYNSQWSTICHHDWDYEDAMVICRQLGFSSVERVVTTSYYGAGTGPVVLDYVRCLGTELNIADCPHDSPFGVVGSDCSTHQYDAGVVCTDG